MTDTLAPTGDTMTNGLAPRGMLWVAWRQRRSLILITLGLYAATAVTIVVRSLLRARDLAGAGVTDLASCGDPGMTTAVLATCERWLAASDSWSTLDSQLSGVPALICALFSLGLGAAAVGHEFERGLGAFSFTQSISPMRWAATHLIVVIMCPVAGILVIDVVTRLLVAERSPVDGSAGVFSTRELWLRPLLVVAMICLAFALSIVTRGSSGGFWGGLGFLIIAGIFLNFVSRSTAVEQSDSLTCPRDGELCSRILAVAFRFRALSVESTSYGTAAWAIALSVIALIGLVTGFLLLSRSF